MKARQSSFANSLDSQGSGGNPAGSKARNIPRSSSRNSINFDTCNSPDFNSVALEKELSDLDLEDQVHIKATCTNVQHSSITSQSIVSVFAQITMQFHVMLHHLQMH